ncbi:ATP-dependent DNA helicase PIF1 [Linum perenne]
MLDLGLPTLICKYCGACFWPQEALRHAGRKTNPKYALCCQHGKVDITLLQETPLLLNQLLSPEGNELARHYQKHIRSYNAAFSWTSFGAKFSQHLLNSRGPYSLVLCGENYHYMGSILPLEGQRPRYSQLYVFDPASEITDRLSNVSSSTRTLNEELMTALKDMLDEYNALTKSFRRVRDALQQPENEDLRLRICGSRVEHDRRYELPTETDLAGLIPGDFEPDHDDRDIIVNHRSVGLTRITSLNPLFDSLHFPLLFPYGNDGYHEMIRYNPLHVDPRQKRKFVTQNEYYNFRLQYRHNEGKTLIRSGKALQHFCIDAFTTIEQNRLLYIRLHQQKLHADLYNGLQDALNRVILPGGFRYLRQLYQDATSVCQFYDNPDLFITFTCNAQWPELVNAFKDVVGTRSEDKPMLVARVFRMRLTLLREDLKKKCYFGRNLAGMHTVEFQKRGLPHAHIVIWLASSDKPNTVDKVDKIISAELPDPKCDPLGYDAVTKFMMHGPCGQDRPSSPCMKEGKCSKYYPKTYVHETTFDANGYVTYRRRQTGITTVKSGIPLDTLSVVPYNRDLLIKYQAHMNVEICHKGQLIKYLFKYILKGPDRSVEQDPPKPRDEIAEYLDCRSISSYEASWRLFQFPIHERTPSVFRLDVHLPGQQTVTWHAGQPVHGILNRPDISKTMLTEWFLLNRTCPSARQYTYSEMPNAFIWDKQASQWTPRKKGFAIGRVRSIPPRAGDVFEHLRTVHGVVYKDYQEACQALGLLSNDNEWNSVMAEVSQWAMAPLIRSTFVALLVFCEVTTPLTLFENWWVSMADDFNHRMQNRSDDPYLEPSPVLLRNEVLQNLQALLQNYSSSLAHYGLPMPTHWTSQLATDDLISQQLQYDTSVEARLYNSYEVLLNTCQRTAHDAVVSALSSSNGKLFFLYGHGGTGKTYFEGKIALVVASSGIAATLLPGGVTAHSRFRIPLDVDSTSTCTIKKGTSLARLMKSASLIVWDEAPMVHRLSFEAVDRTLCDIMDTPTEGVNYKPFGGKTVLLGGDFRQTLPIVAIVTPTNQTVSSINDYVLSQIPGMEKVYLSSDTLTTPSPNQTQLEAEYPTEFLNALAFNDMPEHQLRLKPYSIVMLLRNLNPSAGLCNGTRILLTDLGEHTLRGLIIGGSYEGTIAIIPRIVLDKSDPNWPFTLKRRQYPVHLCYAMTINKSQGQTLEHIGIYLPSPVFSHGQLYVALSRARSVDGIHIVLQNDSTINEAITKNIVYQEIFEDLQATLHA